MDRVEHRYQPAYNLLMQRLTPAFLFALPALIICVLIVQQVINPVFERFGPFLLITLLIILLWLVGFAAVLTCEVLVLTSSYVTSLSEIEIIVSDKQHYRIPWNALGVAQIIELNRYFIGSLIGIRAPLYVVYFNAGSMLHRLTGLRFVGDTQVFLPLLLIHRRHENSGILMDRLAESAGLL